MIAFASILLLRLPDGLLTVAGVASVAATFFTKCRGKAASLPAPNFPISSHRLENASVRGSSPWRSKNPASPRFLLRLQISS